ncbi:hypothetical protein FEE95_06305 [Maribacter algarum]|uniref:Polyhydroxybutyrate depolymerase n=1 Tax=Maribacter algarum (ex Zhang et al. 2020) TaxID=2578118 RepID=A0A5S3PXR5_9FLAO|nr:alpha/beta hydrolase-fold protein [Maribacter algarum]TMM59042.1 hypothetical protein FEE95_06305 [Maribacter algarum]
MKLIPFYIVLFLALSCSKKDDDTPIEQDSAKGLLENLKIDISGEEREYHLYIPQNSENVPVVFLFHGNKSDNDQLIGIGGLFNRDIKAPYKVWLSIAEQENIILVIPKGLEGSTGDNGWNDCRNDAGGNPDSNDALFSSTLIDVVLDTYKGNASKVYAVGTSNGGHMAMRLAHEIPDKLTAFAAIVASNPVNSQCSNSTMPISALIMNGTDDPINPIEGGLVGLGGSNQGNRGEVLSGQETIDYWVSRNQTDTTPITTDFPDLDSSDNSIVKKHIYSNGANNTEVAFYEVIGGGHTEPSIAERYTNAFKALFMVKEQNGDIEMANEVWDFFKTK